MREARWPSAEEVSEARFQKFLEEFTAYEREEFLRVKRDEFLDAFLLWQRVGTLAAKIEVLRLACELRELDPGFAFAFRTSGGTP